MITILWAKTAKEDYWANIEYLEKNWSLNDVSRFIEKVDHVIQKLQKNNITFKPTLYKNTFQVTITKQITLYYKVENDKCILLRFWNNYKDLNKLTL